MARVILETPGEDVTVGGSDVDVLGTSAGGEVITVIGGNVTLDGSFAQGGDTIALPGEAEDYTARIVGSRLILSNGATTVSIPVGTASNAVVFGGDDTRELRIEDGQVVLGDQEIARGSETTLEPGDDDGNIIDALAAYQAARQAVSDFEEEQEMTADEIRAAAQEAAEDLAAARAIRTDAQLQADLAGAEADLEAAEEDIDSVDGLAEAIEDLDDANAEVEAAEEAWVAAQAEFAGQNAEYEALTGDEPDYSDLFYSDGEFSGVVYGDDGDVILEADEDGNLVLADGLTSPEREVVEDLRDAILALVATNERLDAAYDAQADAAARVDLLDTVPSADDERADLAEFEDLVEDYRAALAAYRANPTSATAGALENTYEDLADSDVRFDAYADAAAIAAAEEDIEADIEDEQAEREDALRAAEASNPRYDNLIAAQEAVADAQGAVADREALIDARNEAAAVLAELVQLEGDVADAVEAIEELGYETPVDVEGAAEEATDGSDVFVFVDADGEIEGFGEEGDDILFIGEGYTRVDLEDDVPGEDEVGAFDRLEIFIRQEGDDTVLYIEDETFSGNIDDGTFAGNVIVLADVDADDVVLNADGTITIGDGAAAAAAAAAPVSSIHVDTFA